MNAPLAATLLKAALGQRWHDMDEQEARELDSLGECSCCGSSLSLCAWDCPDARANAYECRSES